MVLVFSINLQAQNEPVNNLHQISVQDMTQKAVSLADYKGQVLLIVNVASKCGYTKQYTGLETLYGKYKNQKFNLLGFPCNDFGGQEPGTLEEIKAFCQSKFNVSFPLFDKVHAKGSEQHPLYKFLTTNAVPPGEVAWNFEKFLVGKDGKIVARYKSGVKPDDADLAKAIEAELGK